MRFQKRWLRSVLLTICSAIMAAGLCAQDLDASSSLVAEDLLIDELLSSDVHAEKKTDVAEETIEEADPIAADEDLLTEVEAVPEVDPQAPTDGRNVEDLAAEVLGEDAQETTIEIPVVEEPVDENAVLSEPTIEEAVQVPPAEPLLEEEPVTDLSVTTPDMVNEEEKGVAAQGVEDLAREALGAETVVEEQPADEKASVAEDAAVNDLLTEVGTDDLVTDTSPEEETVIETVPVEADVDAAATSPSTVQVDETVAEELVETPAAEETVVEEAPVAEELVETPAAEETVVEEAPVAEELVETPAAGETVEEAVIGTPVEGIPSPSAEAGIPTPSGTPARAARSWWPSRAARTAPAIEAGMSTPQVSVMFATEALRRKAYRDHADQTLSDAEKALRDRQYQKARMLFENTIETLNRLGRRPEDERARSRAQTGLAETFYRWALALRKQKDMEPAAEMARKAAAEGHARAPRLAGEIERDKVAPPPVPAPAFVDRWNQEEFDKEEGDIAHRLKLGRQFFMTGEYDEAETKFRGILGMDPYNTEAIRMIEKTARKKREIATMELTATRERMLAELRKAWNPRDYGIEEVEQAELVGPDGPRPDDQTDRVRIENKMKSITIPEVEFRQANIHDVINFLQSASREFDAPDADPSRRGVNIILNLQAGETDVAAPGPAADPFAPAVETAAPAAGGVPLITFSARHISLLEALNIVTKVASLKYRIEGTVVMILPWDAPIGDIIVQTYDVLPSVEQRISDVSAQLGQAAGGFGGGAAVGAGFGALDRAPATTESVDWRGAFTEMGVQWPKGSSIKYVRAMGKLVVANTADNLIQFERILSELNVTPRQIEIETRFVEISQTDLDSLGFEWILTDNWEIAQQTGQAGTALAGRQRIIAQQNADGGFTVGNRFLQGTAASLTGSPVADNVLSISSVLTNPELTMVLHALQQRGSTDLLSAPKVLTQSGVEATIKVVTEYVYPTDFAVTPPTINADGVVTAGAVVEPSGFESREVGVILTVTPEVSPEGQMIDLTMTPEVVSEPIWKNYGTTYQDASGNVQQYNMEQPFFFTRSISTTISIYNGATVVMGGMITEVRNEVNDKIPFLGDIPLLGRLFRSNYENSEKRNLLIFVTAKLVDPAGRPL